MNFLKNGKNVLKAIWKQALHLLRLVVCERRIREFFLCNNKQDDSQINVHTRLKETK